MSGTCFKDALTNAQPGDKILHAMLPFRNTNKLFLHAVILRRRRIYEVRCGFLMPTSAERQWRRTAQHVHEYTFAEAQQHASKSGTYGPWADFPADEV